MIPKVEVLSGGNFVVTWQSENGQDGDGSGIFGQIFDQSGSKVGSEFQVNTTTDGSQTDTNVAGLTDGGFVAVWSSPDTVSDGIYGQKFNSSGQKVGDEFLVNATSEHNQA